MQKCLKYSTLAAFALLICSGSLISDAHADPLAPEARLFDLADFGTPADAQSQLSVGGTPAALVAGPNGTFYGVTQAGGANGDGTVFEVQPYGTGVRALYAFGSGDGPASSLTQSADGSTLYGTFQYGGVNTNGALWKLGADGTGYQTLYAFSATDLSAGGTNPDGTALTGGLLEGANGALFGEAQFGGPNAAGTLFQINRDGTGFSVLHAFGTVLAAGTDGAYPIGGLVAGPDGTLYGVCSLGGAANTGTVFKVNPDGSGYAVLHEFAADDDQRVNSGGAVPSASLTLGADGLLYGVTVVGGSGGSGVVFRLGADGSGYAVLTEFTGTENAVTGGDGGSPLTALVLDKTGTLYGTTTVGGDQAQGTVYRISTGGVYASLYALQAGDGTGASLVTGSSGLVYGLTGDGGGSAAGELFRVDTNHATTHVLCTKPSGQMALWNENSADGTKSQQVYGPFPGWIAQKVADGPDGLTHVLWTQSSGQISVWSLDAALGVYTHAEYGPYPGWTAIGLSVGPDNTEYVLWTHTSGRMSLWSISAIDGSVTQKTYGPFTPWTAKAIAAGPDGLLHVLWTQSSGQISVWGLDAAAGVYTHSEFGPFSGWTAQTATISADNTLHIQWSHLDGRLSVWNNTISDPNYNHVEYGPYGDWSAAAISDGPDNLSRVLWTQPSGQASVWDLDNSLATFTHFEYTPDPGWTPKAISAGL